MMPQLDFAFYSSQIFWFFCSFGFLLLVVSFVVYPRIEGAFSLREERLISIRKKTEEIEEAIGALSKKIRQNSFSFIGEMQALEKEFARQKYEMEQASCEEIAVKIERFLVSQKRVDLQFHYSKEVHSLADDVAGLIVSKLSNSKCFASATSNFSSNVISANIGGGKL